MSDPRIWSNDYWGMMHRAAIKYPEKPTAEDKVKAKQFFGALDLFVPCPTCSIHYGKHYAETFNDSVLESSETLQRWVYDLHCAVNKRLGIENTVKFEDVKKMYNSFPSRYVDMDTGKVLSTPRFTYNYGVSQPADAAPRQWLVDNVGQSLDDRSIFALIFTPLGEKQEKRSRCLAIAVALLLAVLAGVFLTIQYQKYRKSQEEESVEIVSQSRLDQR